MLYKHIDTVQFDLNVICNAFCPGCHRYAVVDDEMYLNPFLPFNTSVGVNIVERVMENQRLLDDVVIDMVGLVGEPIAHQEFLDIVDIIYRYKPNARIQIHTNGGLRSTEFFKELAHKFNKDSWITFSIDGLKDTNHKYRIGVIWDKVMENAKAFIDAGGNARWKCLNFPWNIHQKEEIELLSSDMGFKKFRWDKNRDENTIWMERWVKAAENFNQKTKAKLGYKQVMRQSHFNHIKNRCFDEEAIYINYEGKVLPCCMFNASLTDECYMDEMTPYINENNGNWNSLEHNSLEEVMNNKWWHKLYGHLDTTPCTVCIHSCDTVK